MPGFWGQYGPKARSADFLEPLHYAYDHFDHQYRGSGLNLIDNTLDGIVKINYVYSSMRDVPNLARNDNVIIPIYFLQNGQRIVSIEGDNIVPEALPPFLAGYNSSMGIWLYSADFTTVWDQKLWSPADIPGEPAHTSMPTDLATRTLCELGPQNMTKLGYPNLYRFVDFSRGNPPFRVVEDSQPKTPQSGHYVCLCVRRSQTPTSQLLLRVELTVAGGRHVAL